jgi:hypothetical protein
LDWDQETYMPKEAIEARSLQIELLASLAHRQKTSKAFAKALSALIDMETGEISDDRLTTAQIAALREWRSLCSGGFYDVPLPARAEHADLRCLARQRLVRARRRTARS